MGGDTKPLQGPDLEKGVPFGDLRDGEALLGHAHGAAVILVKEGDSLYATGASCTHYGGPLSEGLVVSGTVRCPWHHACFDLRTGEAVGAPALSPISCYEVVREGALVKLGKERAPTAKSVKSAPASVVIVGAGAAGAVCAETLRREGYSGTITLLGAEAPGPVDRPNLSKDYLAGNAPEEWIPLRTKEAFAEQNIELLVGDPVAALDTAAQSVRLASGRSISYGALVLATGAVPVRLPIDGASLPHVHLLRTLDDSRAIIAQLGSARRAVVIGSSFIGLEAAASLRQRGLEVTVVSRDAVPLERVVGADVGRFVQSVHEGKGVVFHLNESPQRITESAVELASGKSLPCELVVMGVGVRPETTLAQAAGIKVENGIVTDAHLKTSAANVYAAGDVARFPYAATSNLVRIEHWVVAERQAQAVARDIVGRGAPFRDVPFFWSQHHDVTLAYVGHAEQFDTPEIRGNLAAHDAAVIYRDKGSRRVAALLTIGRDRLSLQVEHAMERGDHDAVEKLLVDVD
jgi:NADPH-dependent 2,4-dienoyl-CoA reductase/sulfur reductase-like enzyme/nitrite reductase/ring-hydroxylating ferredoxin subunit